MPLQGTLAVRPVSISVCPICSEHTRCVEISFKQDERKQGVIVCTSCLIDPGVAFDVNINVRTQQPAHIKRRTRKRVKREELQTAEEIGGRTTVASGGMFQDGDVKNDKWMVEEKSTQYKSFSIKEEVISKALSQASRQGRNFVIKVRTAKKTLGILLWQDLLPLIKEDDE